MSGHDAGSHGATRRKDYALPQIELEKIVLPNGLQLILHIDRKLPVVHVNQWYHVGSKNEKRGRTGFAHLFEHIMFQGSVNAKNDYFAFVERAGANLREGGVNGTTDHDRTNYFATVPSGNLELLLWVESDRLATLAEALTQEKLDNQREVVRNERRQSYENQPYGRAFQLLTEHLHPPEHPYSWDVIGSHADLVAASLDDVREFFQRFYIPNNLSLVVAGDFDPDEAKRLVELYFGSIPSGDSIDRMGSFIPSLAGEKVIEVLDKIPQERVYIAWPAPGYFAPDSAELDIASLILSDGLSSRLARRLVYDEEICTDVRAFSHTLEISGAFVVVATARPGASLSDIETAIHEELRRVARDGVSSAELDRTITKWEYGFVTGLERIGGFGGKADLLNMYNTFRGDPGLLDEDVRRYRGATPESVASAVGRWLDREGRLVVRFRPEAAPVARVEISLDRSQQPEQGDDRPFFAPVVQSAVLDNGLTVFVVERSELPKVAVSLATHAGSLSDDRGLEGTASLTASTLATGTSTRDTLAIEDALGDHGTSIDASGGRELSLLSFDVLRRNLEPTLEIVSEVLQDPTFPIEDFLRERARHLDGLSQLSNNPTSVAGRIRPMLLFGRDHGYGRPGSGLPSTVARITREDLVTFHRRWWTPGSSALVFSGAITLDEAVKATREAFGTWQTTGPARAVTRERETPAWGTTYLVDRPGAAQTIISQILDAPGRTVEDFYVFRLLDAIWGGGGFGTRLNLNLREEKGYSYGVFSNAACYRDFGIWWASGGVQTDKTAEALGEFVRELEGLGGDRPITEEEVEYARSARVRGYAQQFESLGRVASQVTGLWGRELPMTELQEAVERTSRATLDEVRAAATKYVRPAESILLLVGDLAVIEAPVRAMSSGDVVVLDPEGNVLR